MAGKSPSATVLRFADLPQRRETAFDIAPGTAALASLAARVGVDEIRKLRFAGTVTPQGRSDWRLEADLSATVVQPCIVTLAPVTTRIEEYVTRRYLAGYDPVPEADEAEIPEDDTIEPLGAEIDLEEIMVEALSLALPQYPRAPDAELGEAVFTEPGKTPMTDDDARPFAGLADLKARLDRKE